MYKKIVQKWFLIILVLFSLRFLTPSIEILQILGFRDLKFQLPLFISYTINYTDGANFLDYTFIYNSFYYWYLPILKPISNWYSNIFVHWNEFDIQKFLYSYYFIHSVQDIIYGFNSSLYDILYDLSFFVYNHFYKNLESGMYLSYSGYNIREYLLNFFTIIFRLSHFGSLINYWGKLPIVIFLLSFSLTVTIYIWIIKKYYTIIYLNIENIRQYIFPYHSFRFLHRNEQYYTTYIEMCIRLADEVYYYLSSKTSLENFSNIYSKFNQYSRSLYLNTIIPIINVWIFSLFQFIYQILFYSIAIVKILYKKLSKTVIWYYYYFISQSRISLKMHDKRHSIRIYISHIFRTLLVYILMYFIFFSVSLLFIFFVNRLVVVVYLTSITNIGLYKFDINHYLILLHIIIIIPYMIVNRSLVNSKHINFQQVWIYMYYSGVPLVIHFFIVLLFSSKKIIFDSIGTNLTILSTLGLVIAMPMNNFFFWSCSYGAVPNLSGDDNSPRGSLIRIFSSKIINLVFISYIIWEFIYTPEYYLVSSLVMFLIITIAAHAYLNSIGGDYRYKFTYIYLIFVPLHMVIIFVKGTGMVTNLSLYTNYIMPASMFEFTNLYARSSLYGQMYQWFFICATFLIILFDDYADWANRSHPLEPNLALSYYVQWYILLVYAPLTIPLTKSYLYLFTISNSILIYIVYLITAGLLFLVSYPEEFIQFPNQYLTATNLLGLHFIVTQNKTFYFLYNICICISYFMFLRDIWRVLKYQNFGLSYWLDSADMKFPSKWEYMFKIAAYKLKYKATHISKKYLIYSTVLELAIWVTWTAVFVLGVGDFIYHARAWIDNGLLVSPKLFCALAFIFYYHSVCLSFDKSYRYKISPWLIIYYLSKKTPFQKTYWTKKKPLVSHYKKPKYIISSFIIIFLFMLFCSSSYFISQLLFGEYSNNYQYYSGDNKISFTFTANDTQIGKRYGKVKKRYGNTSKLNKIWLKYETFIKKRKCIIITYIIIILLIIWIILFLFHLTTMKL